VYNRKEEKRFRLRRRRGKGFPDAASAKVWFLGKFLKERGGRRDAIYSSPDRGRGRSPLLCRGEMGRCAVHVPKKEKKPGRKETRPVVNQNQRGERSSRHNLLSTTLLKEERGKLVHSLRSARKRGGGGEAPLSREAREGKMGTSSGT